MAKAPALTAAAKKSDAKPKIAEVKKQAQPRQNRKRAPNLKHRQKKQRKQRKKQRPRYSPNQSRNQR